jgi:hypothetical protein
MAGSLVTMNGRMDGRWPPRRLLLEIALSEELNEFLHRRRYEGKTDGPAGYHNGSRERMASASRVVRNPSSHPGIIKTVFIGPFVVA